MPDRGQVSEGCLNPVTGESAEDALSRDTNVVESVLIGH